MPQYSADAGPLTGDSSLTWQGDALVTIDQRALPHEYRQLRLASVDELIEAIQTLAIRGAPALGLAGAFGVAISARRHQEPELDTAAVHGDAKRLADARPTAVNLAWGVQRALSKLADGPDAVLQEAMDMVAEDVRTNRAAVARAADLVETLCPDRPLRLLTHCNTGRLATAAVGTALGTIVELARRGRVAEVLVNETRPLLQGARLTMWELQEAGVPCRLQVDSAAAAAMAQGLVDCVLVGADRIARNGDVANKIGTYAVAVAASAHGVPLIVVAPESTWDESLPDGSGIVVEQREPAEVLALAGVGTAPAGSAVHNPGFDVTPNGLVTALVSERRTVRPGLPATGPASTADRVTAALTTFPDYPEPGVLFRDLAGVYAEPGLLQEAAEHILERLGTGFDRVLAIESRGFVLGAFLAGRARVPLTLARKAGKLPGSVHQARYTLEYGDDSLEMQQSAVSPGERVVCVDDVLATGGTLGAAAELVVAAGGTVAGMAVLVALDGLGGSQRLERHRLIAVCEVPA